MWTLMFYSLDLKLISKMDKLLFQDCKSNLPAPVQTVLLIFPDMALSYLNNILRGNSGLELGHLLWPKVMIMVAKAWSKILFYILDHPLMISNDLDKAQEHFSAL